jgi:TolA-binding protein
LDDNAANLGMANVMFAEGRYSAAREIYRNIAESSSIHIGAEAQFMLGRTYQQERNFEEALASYARVSVLFEAYIDWVAEAKYRSAEIHITQGNRGEAISVLNEINNNYPGTEAAEKAQRLLDRN